jgi:YVTN family beta-propeller protein
MHARDHHGEGHRGRTAARWRGGAVVVAVIALSLAAGPVAASAAGGYTVTANIPVGGDLQGVAVDASTHTVYVPNPDYGTVAVIDEATNKVKTTITVGPGPDAVAADPAAGTFYVTNSFANTVSVIDAATNTVTATIAVGTNPSAVAADPAAGTVYVANTDVNTVSVIDAATNTVTATIHVPVSSNPSGVAVDPATRTVYVANLGANTVSVIDAATNAITATIPVGGAPEGVAVDHAAGIVYVTNSLTNTVSVIDAATNTVIATIPIPTLSYLSTGATPSGVAVDPSTHTAYVANFFGGTVSVISAPRPVPVVTVTSSHNPGVFGGKVTFTATAAPADGGTITFSNGAKALCRAVALTEVSGRKYHATCTTTALPAGRDTITAAYPGDASYAASAGRLTQTVTRAPTALTAAIGPGPHHVFTLTATLTASSRPLSGQPVTFSTGPTRLCTPHTSTRGADACVLTGPQTLLVEHDHDAVRASYPGNASYQPSSATATQPAAARSLAHRGRCDRP